MPGMRLATRCSAVRLAGPPCVEVGELMTVRKCETTYRQVDQDYPVQIEIRIEATLAAATPSDCRILRGAPPQEATDWA
jgi:hypothetical protein